MAITDGKPYSQLTPEKLERFWEKVDRSGGPDACWIWTGSTTVSGGYGQFNVGGRPIRAHRIAYFLEYRVDPGSLYACHRCDRPACVNPLHLFLATNAENIQDCISKGRFTNGDAHYSRRHPELIWRGEKKVISKLKDADIVEIRRLYATGSWLQREIAAKFGVTRATIWAVLSGKTWTHI